MNNRYSNIKRKRMPGSHPLIRFLARAMLALVAFSVALGGIAPAGQTLQAAPTAQAAGIEPAAADAVGAAEEQPQSWLLKWRDPALASELRGTRIIRRQVETAVYVVAPADPGADIAVWLAQLRATPGVQYVHPNNTVHMLSMPTLELNSEIQLKEGAKAFDSLSGSQQPLPQLGEESASSDPLSTSQQSHPDEEEAAPPDLLSLTDEEAALSDSLTHPDEEAAPSDSLSHPDEQPESEPELIPMDQLQNVQPLPKDEPAALNSTQSETATSQLMVVEANDPELAKQVYLKQIGALNAWETAREQTDITIAIIDTGVDLEHPDLKSNLVQGANLVHPGELPQDDNGHGTSVAGVLAAVGNNGIGVSGVLWNANIMPVKALDHNGDGTEQDLGEAILYAIKNNAKIIVLSVGLHRYSPYMLDIVNYAESHGVVLVAAVGNDGVKYGQKAEIKYPAAYPTVLAVGGVKPNNTADPRSNPGTEIDIVAAWNVFTTALGGSYHREEGSSMSAPQAAAAAALLWARNPELKPHEIRTILRQTAKDIGEPGFDRATGYGLLQIDKALQQTLNLDSFEPNNNKANATPFPLASQIHAVLEKNGDKDWYRIEAPYDGTLTIQYEGLISNASAVPPVRIFHYEGNSLNSITDTKLASRTFDLAVQKGISYIMLEQSNQATDVNLPYLLTSSFTMKMDAFEKNDRSYEAATLPPVSQTITGNFHQTADRDWFVIHFTQTGTLNLTLSTNTARIDPALAVQPAGQSLQLYDELGQAQTEKSPVITVSPGKYYIRVHNAISAEASPVAGTYTLTIDYTPKYDDPNEPNDKMYESLMINPGSEYVGVIGKTSDEDWFQYRIKKTSIVSMTVDNVPNNINLKLDGFTKRQSQLFSSSTGSSGKLQTVERLLDPDVYYVRLTANKAFDTQYYRLKVKVEELVSGYRDIGSHWAVKEISAMSEKAIVNGVGNYRFEPNRSITRAEAVTMIVKAYKPAASDISRPAPFKDVSYAHWANDAIKRAVQQGWINGFRDGRFKPDSPITRAEMAVLIGKAEGIKPRLMGISPFNDVNASNWAAPMLTSMKAAGYIKGTDMNLFNPDAQATRAEFTVLLHRVYN